MFTYYVCDFSILVLVALASVVLYMWAFTKWNYWKSRGVPYLKPVFPIVGNMYDLLLVKGLPDIANRIYKQTEGFPYVGVYAFYTPVLFVRDLDLIARILVSDFDYFEDRGFSFNKNDSLGRNLVHQKGSDWKFSRSKLTPCFNITRVKSMFPSIKKKSEALVQRLEKHLYSNSNVEMWDTSLRYSTDVITLCTMGVEANALIIDKEHFLEAGTCTLGLHLLYHIFIGSFYPKLHKFLGISVAKYKIKQFFKLVLKQILDYRKNNPKKADLIQTLIKMKEDYELNEEENIIAIDNNFIVAQAFAFFFTGFESPGTVLSCALYEIAKHPHIQRALVKEIKDVVNQHKNEVTFDAVQDMKYLRQVIAETLRMYVPLPLIFRRCTKNYTIPGTNTIVEKGTLVLVPLRNIHKDHKLYPEPDTFDPERFAEDKAASRHTTAFMPFGVGPRVCPAVLFSHIEIKMAMVNILLKLQVSLAKTTEKSLEASPTHFLFSPKSGIELAFTHR